MSTAVRRTLGSSKDSSLACRLGMSREGLQQRNLMVYRSCRKAAVPLVVCMGGGYCSLQELQLTVDAHSDVYRLAALHLAGKV